MSGGAKSGHEVQVSQNSFGPPFPPRAYGNGAGAVFFLGGRSPTGEPPSVTSPPELQSPPPPFHPQNTPLNTSSSRRPPSERRTPGKTHRPEVWRRGNWNAPPGTTTPLFGSHPPPRKTPWFPVFPRKKSLSSQTRRFSPFRPEPARKPLLVAARVIAPPRTTGRAKGLEICSLK